MKGILTLVPTPIDEESTLEQTACSILKNAFLNDPDNSIFVVEELKPGRKRWLKWGLPREVVNDFAIYNEHNAKKAAQELLIELQNGKNVYLMSDGGLPAFCDPGVELVNLCHQTKIKVTSTPFANSISLAIALSGFKHDQFIFFGFLPVKKVERLKALEGVFRESRVSILMDTPYRLKTLIEDCISVMAKTKVKRSFFLALDLNSTDQELHQGNLHDIIKKIKNFKREFILIVGKKK